MNILSRRTNGNALCLTIDDYPNLSPGLNAPLGSEAVVIKNSTGSTWVKYGPLDTEWKNLDDTDIKDQIFFHEDWFSSTPVGSNSFVATTASGGTASTTALASSGNILGVVTLTNTNTNGSNVSLNNAPTNGGYTDLSNKEVTFEALLNIPSTFNNKSFYIGLGKIVSTSEQSDGVYFKYRGSESANWQCKTAIGSVRTTVNSGVSITTSGWIHLKIISSSGSVKFYVNNALVATISTNIPTTSLFTVMQLFSNSGGDGTRSVHIDYVTTKINLFTPRL